MEPQKWRRDPLQIERVTEESKGLAPRAWDNLLAFEEIIFHAFTPVSQLYSLRRLDRNPAQPSNEITIP